MNLKTWAKENGKTLAEAKELTGLTHWNQRVPESCDEITEVPEDTVIETESKQEWDCPVSYRKLFHSIKRRRSRSPYWEYRHLLRK